MRQIYVRRAVLEHASHGRLRDVSGSMAAAASMLILVATERRVLADAAPERQASTGPFWAHPVELPLAMKGPFQVGFACLACEGSPFVGDGNSQKRVCKRRRTGVVPPNASCFQPLMSELSPIGRGEKQLAEFTVR